MNHSGGKYEIGDLSDFGCTDVSRRRKPVALGGIMDGEKSHPAKSSHHSISTHILSFNTISECHQWHALENNGIIGSR
jgi:hypothetical protein